VRTPEGRLRWLARLAWLLTVPFVRYEIRGGACARTQPVGIVAANHRSLFDVIAGLIALHHFRRYVRVLIAREYAEGKWTAPLCRAIGAIPVDRGEGGRPVFDVAIGALHDGIPILVMPEGRLHWDPAAPLSTGPAKTGISRLAVGAGVPILPAALVGTERVFPATAKVPHLNPFRRKRVVVNVCDDVLWLDGDDHEANTEQVMATIRDLMSEAAALPPAGPAGPA
jgi:1-acyl-sn-glycerol-3-phosphate acyltransferase